jgi:hydroxymethylpyrimidine pyrophosphatase-like HAD family hydrolase
MAKKVICVDLDGTILEYDNWRGENEFGLEIEGASQALTYLKNLGHTIIIYTTRSDHDKIAKYLDQLKVPFDFINENPDQPKNSIGEKLYADIYIDDRAISFKGSWEDTLKQILEIDEESEKNSLTCKMTDFSKTFLSNDFDQSYQQLRHYDSLNWEITKFSFVELLLGITSVWAIYVFAKDPLKVDTLIAKRQFLIIPSILGICYLFSILASFLISRNRVYYAKVARYINEHRHFVLSSKPLNFQNVTGFYTDYNLPPAFDIWSTHLVSLYVIQFIGACVFGGMTFSILFSFINNEIVLLGTSLISGIISLFVNFIFYSTYMKRQDKKLGSCREIIS